LAIALSIRACLAGQRVQFATATQWVARLSEAKRQGNLETELRRLSFIPLIVVDEVGCAPRGAMRPGGMRGPPPAAATAG
jgi:DNA replication protein DnaC